MILDIHFTTLESYGPVKGGMGKTIDASSSGISFTADSPLLIGQRIKAYIDWPVMLNGSVKLQLAVSGVVVRTDGAKIAIRIEGHDFKTCSLKQRSA